MLIPLLATLACLVAGGILWFSRSDARLPSWLRGRSDEDDAWLDVGLNVEMPDAEIEAYNEIAAKLHEAKQGSAEAQRLHKAAKTALSRRAKVGLAQWWKAAREVERRWRMHQTKRMSDDEYAGVLEEFEPFKNERRIVVQEATKLQPGWPVGWGESIYVEAQRDLLAVRQKMLAVGAHEDDERLPPKALMRFSIGDRVACNVGKESSGAIKWARGTVIQALDLPYRVALDDGSTRVNAPQDNDGIIRAVPDDDKGTPSGINLALWRPFRFSKGDRVYCNCGEKGWLAGTIEAVDVTATKEAGGKRNAYAVRLDLGMGVLAPMDVEQVVRATAPEGLQAPAPPVQLGGGGGEAPAGMGRHGRG